MGKAYSIENLQKFFDDDPDYLSELASAVADHKSVLLIIETRGTLYDLFLPLVLQHLVEEIGYIPPQHRRRKQPKPGEDLEKETETESEWDDDSLTYEDPSDHSLPPVTDQLIHSILEKHKEKIDSTLEISEEEFEGKPKTYLFLDAATHLSKFERSFKFALNIPEKYPNVSVAASFFTNREVINKTLQEGILEYMSERALIFDFHPMLFDVATSRIPISKKAWLQGKLQEMERIRSEGDVAFLEYNKANKEQWVLQIVEKPDFEVITKIRSWFRRTIS